MLIPTILHAYFFEDKISEQGGDTIASGVDNVIFQDGNQIIFQDGNHMVTGTEVSGGTSFEAETTALMTALAIPNDGAASAYTGLSNSDIWTIVNNRFLGYKSAGLMTEILAEWWMLGNTATQHSYNAMNPSAFQLTWLGGWVHDENGALGNGTNSYAQTGFTPSAQQNVNSNGLAVTTGASVSLSGLQVQIGAFDSLTQASTLIISTSGNMISRVNGDVIQAANTDGIGGFYAVRQSSVLSKIFKNMVNLISGNSGGTLVTREIYLGAFNNAGSVSNYARQRFQNSAMLTGLSDAQITAHQTIVDQFETALGRKTW